ncbi:hypothetical protein [Ideonella paludis]|uniref:VCBS repeat-containing protein n=1 Tax=Ideonella paludis TaxID=1233411 RepID=A0ABS5DT23_9BURK|nr:hypothetical protein [Ideonella paludis]MBQ0934300.1 hypothetical protein [Ideonella paludis]
MTRSFTGRSRRALSVTALALAGLAAPLHAADRAAADAAVLLKAIQDHAATDKEFALENALRAFEAPGVVQIDTKRKGESDDQQCVWPARKPAAVTDDEWQALRRSVEPQPGEMGCSTYLLMDMDEDGRRDLLQRTYVGGTGLFTEYSALKRVGRGFVRPSKGDTQSAKGGIVLDPELFSTNDRGAHQWYDLVKLQGRFYVAYVEGSFGQDHVALLRPTELPAGVAAITVDYRYQFSVPRRQTFGPEGQARKVELRPALQSTLEAALARYASGRPAPALAQACPAPAGASEDEAARYAGFGPVHYSMETAADFPFHWQGHCHLAQLNTWFGRYDRSSGLFNQLKVRRADRDEEGLEYEVLARRRFLKASVVP